MSESQTSGKIAEPMGPLHDEKSDIPQPEPKTIDDTVSVDNCEHSLSDDEEIIQDFAQNPMMDRVQAALHKQLMKTYDRVKRELLEQEEAFRVAKKQREDCGVSLYGHQQRLARLQQTLETANASYSNIVEFRQKDEAELDELKMRCGASKSSADKMRKNVDASQKELDSLNETLRQVKKYDDEMKSEIAVTKRATRKVDEDMKNLEKRKLSQDFYIDSLNEQIRRLEEDIALSEAQLTVQLGQTNEAKEMLQETVEELDRIAFEKKQLVLQWKSSLVALARRDEALSVAKGVLKDTLSATRDAEVETEGIRREIKKAVEEHESLLSLRNRLDTEAKSIEEATLKLRAEHQETLSEYDMLEKSLINANEREAQAHSLANSISSKMSSVNNSIDLVTRERHALEEKIDSAKHEQSAMLKATNNLKQTEKSLLAKIHEKEFEAANIQNELARISIDILNNEGRNHHLQEKLKEVKGALEEKNVQVEKREVDIKRRSNEIEQKMHKVDKLNRQYEKMTDGLEEPEALGPLEATIKSYKKDIEQEDEEIQAMQRQWLSDQTSLVQTISDADAVQDKNRELSAKANILNQKRLRLSQEIHMNESEIKSLEGNIQGMHSDMSRLNSLIGRHAETLSDLHHKNAIMDNEFAQELKDLEGTAMKVDEEIADINATKSRILDQLIEVEKQILSYEKKIQLEKETRNTLDNSEEKDEIKGMEREIYRMRHRLESMRRDQEKMIREMEQAIYKREDIAVKYRNKGSDRTSGPVKAKVMSAADIKRQKNEYKKQLKGIEVDISKLREKMKSSQQQVDELYDEMDRANTRYSQLEVTLKDLQNAIDTQTFEKQRILARSDRVHSMRNSYESINRSKNGATDGDENGFQGNYQRLVDSVEDIKNIQRLVTNLRLKHPEIDDMLQKVDFLASDVVEECL